MKSNFLKTGVLCLSLVASLMVSSHVVYGQTVEDDSVKNTTQFKTEQAKALAEIKKFEVYAQSQKNIVKDPKAVTKPGTMSTMSTDTYPTRNGVILVTTDGSSSGIGTGHAGIIWTSTTTVESFPSGGVQTMPNTWNSRYSKVYGVTAKGTTNDQDNNASNWCYSKRGFGYNAIFTNVSRRDKFYCSQLVYAAFLDNYSLNLDDDGGIVWPSDLVNSKNSTLLYVK